MHEVKAHHRNKQNSCAVTEPLLVKYGDVFSSSVAVQEVGVSRFGQLLEARERILENQAPPHQS